MDFKMMMMMMMMIMLMMKGTNTKTVYKNVLHYVSVSEFVYNYEVKRY